MSNPYYSRGNIRYFLVPLAVALAGFLIFVAVVPWTFQEFAPESWELLDDVRMEGKVALARHFMGASFLIFLCACASAFFLSWRVVRENVPRGEMPFFLGMYVVSLAVLGGAISLVSGAPLYEHLGKGMFESTVGSFSGRLLGVSALGWLWLKNEAANLLAAISASLLALAACALVPGKAEAFAGAGEGERRAYLERQQKDLRLLLYVAAAVLAAGVIEMKAWREWPLAFLQEKSAAALAYAEVARGSVQFQATHFALILAAIFVPAAFRLNEAYSRLPAPAGAAGQAPNLWAEWGNTFKALFAILSPFLASPVTQLLENLLLKK